MPPARPLESVEAAADPAAAGLPRDAADTVVQGDATAGRGVAYLVAWPLSGHDSDLDHAVQWLSTATQAEPTQTRATNLALALLDAAPLGARLAVLSGCATGRTAITHADEGLALASARPPAEALRSAQTKAIAANSRTANWAAFVLLGQ